MKAIRMRLEPGRNYFVIDDLEDIDKIIEEKKDRRSR